jgi:hypothetical protein
MSRLDFFATEGVCRASGHSRPASSERNQNPPGRKKSKQENRHFELIGSLLGAETDLRVFSPRDGSWPIVPDEFREVVRQDCSQNTKSPRGLSPVHATVDAAVQIDRRIVSAEDFIPGAARTLGTVVLLDQKPARLP